MPLAFKSLPASEKSTGDRRLTDDFSLAGGLDLSDKR